MPKKKEKITDPALLYLGVWQNEAEFFQYLRGRMRAIWSKYPPKLEFKKPLLIDKFEGCGVDNPRVKKVGQCNCCKNWFAGSNLEVDHIICAGGFNSTWESFSQWVQKLLLTDKGFSNLQLLCKNCHYDKSLSDRMGISLQEAKIRRSLIAFSKESPEIQIEFLKLHCIIPDKTKVGRLRQYKDLFANGGLKYD